MSEEWLHKNANGGGSIHRTREQAEEAVADWAERCKTKHPTEPMPPASLGIFHRTVTEWVPVDSVEWTPPEASPFKRKPGPLA